MVSGERFGRESASISYLIVCEHYSPGVSAQRPGATEMYGGGGGVFEQATVYVGVALTSVHASVIKGLEYNVVVVA